MRLFLAILLDGTTRAAIEFRQHSLMSGRPVPYENLHLTLLFLGEQPEQVLEDLHHEISEVCAPAFPLRFTTTESFGRVLAINVAIAEPLVNLHSALKSAVRRAGITLPRRRFRPHVTIARAVGRSSVTAEATDATAGLAQMPVAGFSLFRSTLRPEGARHEELARYPLCSAGGWHGAAPVRSV